MIPKIIHYVWLSGEEKPQLIKDCISSWRKQMPDFEVREWSMESVRDIKSDFLHEAIAARKWAFATDFLRFYIIYHYGGIYLDSDVYVFRSLTPLLGMSGFTSLEGSAITRTERNKNVDFGLEAAVFGAVKNSPWIKGILSFYETKHFINKPKFYLSIIAPKVMWRQTESLGLRKVLSFQRLKGNVIILPMDTLSCIADGRLYSETEIDKKCIGDINPVKYAVHLCSNSWGWEGQNIA